VNWGVEEDEDKDAEEDPKDPEEDFDEVNSEGGNPVTFGAN